MTTQTTSSPSTAARRFDNKTVLVTGGNSGIGLATALQFAGQGARVVITGRDPATLDQAKAQLGAGAIALRNDAGEQGAAKALADALRAQGITLDAVFINAGVAKFAPLEGVDEALWDQTFNVNVKGAFFAIQALSPLLNTGAAVILNGSINAHIGMPNSSVYAASKAALISLAKTLSAELVARGIRVNVVSPGPVTTPLYGKLGVPGDAQAQRPQRPQAVARDPVGIGRDAVAALDLADQHAARVARQRVRDLAGVVDDDGGAGVGGADHRPARTPAPACG
jgi:NAD(P)-dependent dehydrogenase (short-subunit alcohol dehydrogenase family)